MLTVEEKTNFLKDVSTFGTLSSGQVKAIAGVCEDKIYRTETTIFHQGDLDSSLYVVVDGLIAIEREVTDEDDNILLTVIKPHEYFGEISLFYRAPKSVTATAMQDTIILQIRRDVFLAFARQNPDLLMELNHVLSQRLIESLDKISELSHSRKPREFAKLYR
jgi:CRP-like cAMP-binding protein